MRLEDDVKLLCQEADGLQKKLAERRVISFISECEKKGDKKSLEDLLEREGLPPNLKKIIKVAIGRIVSLNQSKADLFIRKKKIKDGLLRLRSLGLWTDDPKHKECALCLEQLNRERFFKSPDQEFYNLENEVRQAISRAKAVGIKI